MITLEATRDLVLSACSPLRSRSLPTAGVLGLVTDGPLVAPWPVPSFVNSAMDGFALRSADLGTVPTELRVVADIPAGAPWAGTLRAGEAARIMTGAPLPDGADAVCPVEQTRAGSGPATVGILAPVGPGRHVRHPGEDVRQGDLVIDTGTLLSPAHLGLLASLGIDRVRAVPRPTVGVLSTGDELTTLPGPPTAGRIRDANRPALLAALAEAGCLPVDLGIVPDDGDRLAAALLDGARRCDALVTSGGVSVGDHDLTRLVLERLCGPSTRWLQVALKPGKPFAFGTLPRTGQPLFGLPGNPVAALVVFALIVRPALRHLAGHRPVLPPTLRATASAPIPRRPDGKLHAVRALATVDADGRLTVAPSPHQGSHLLRTMADANALVLLPDGPGVEAGAPVEVLLQSLDRTQPETASGLPAGLALALR